MVARGRDGVETLHEASRELSAGGATREFEGEVGVAQHDARLDLAGVGEEPRATGEGEEQIAVRLADLEDATGLVLGEVVALVTSDEVTR